MNRLNEDKFDIDSYRPRLVDRQITELLKRMSSVMLVGPKWCGKTWTATKAAKSAVYLGDPAAKRTALSLMERIIDGDQPRLIDEWQDVPELFDAIRHRIDRAGCAPGQYILAGSSRPPMGKTMHDGVGRFAMVRMTTMTLSESGEGSRLVSLSALLDGNFEGVLVPELNLHDIAHLILRGGWAMGVGAQGEGAYVWARSVTDMAISALQTRVRTGETRIRKVFESAARRECGVFSYSDMARDFADHGGETLSWKTISRYASIMEENYLLDPLEPFTAHFRSAARVREKRKIRFFDPAVAAAVLGISSPEALLGDLRTMGFLFESLCIRDVKAYAQAFGGRTAYYRDYAGGEIDIIVTGMDGKWGAFEVKLGDDGIDSAASKLIKLTNEAGKGKLPLKPPAALGVITATGGAAYRRKDGVYVLPISCLRE